MSILTNLFGESPFGALEAHGEKVAECLAQLQQLFQAQFAGERGRVEELAQAIFGLESEADAIRNHIHELLSSRVLLPLKRDEFFNVLEQQDSLADTAEEIAALLLCRNLQLPEPLRHPFAEFLEKVFGNCTLAAGVMSKLDLLVESSFSGRDALTVSRLITELSEKEDALKAVQINLTRQFLSDDSYFPPLDAVLWLQMIRHVADLSSFANRIGTGIRLALKVPTEK